MYRLTVFCILAIVPLAVAADKEPLRHDEVVRLSRRLERDVREMREEVLVAFRGKPGFRELEEKVREIEKLAGMIHKITERDERSRRVKEILGKMDEEVSHFERHLHTLGRERDIDRRVFEHVRDDLNDIHRILYRLRKEL